MRIEVLAMAVLICGCTSENRLGREAPSFSISSPQVIDPPTQVDHLVQVTIPVVDALFIVDNSCSMEEEQAALAANFPVFSSWFVGSGLDFHIGVISTDMRDPEHTGKLRDVNGVRWVTEGTEDPDGTFTTMAVMGTDGDGVEAGRAAGYTALEVLADGHNEGFLRGGSGVHLTVVSDENDASGSSPVTRSEWVDYLRNLRFSLSDVSFSSVVGPTTGCEDAVQPGTDYTAVTGLVGGVVWPICTDDWSAALGELGLLATGLSREFFLSRLPVADSIEVEVTTNGAVNTGAEWTYDPARNAITFLSLLPDPLATVTIRYRVLSAL